MTFTEPVVTKPILAQQYIVYIVKNIYTHPINGLVADIIRHRQLKRETRSQRTKRYFYFVCTLKESPGIYNVMISSPLPSLY
jgi:K+-sensing histidine kinase KdpD